MADFESPTDLEFNRGLIADHEAFARAANAASWLFLCGEQFATVEGGMSYADVQAAVAESANACPIRRGCSTWIWPESRSRRSTGCLDRPS
jgi:hypothetical protein